MKQLQILFVALITSALFLWTASCGSDDNGGSSTGDTTTEADATEQPDAASQPDAVATGDTQTQTTHHQFTEA